MSGSRQRQRWPAHHRGLRRRRKAGNRRGHAILVLDAEAGLRRQHHRHAVVRSRTTTCRRPSPARACSTSRAMAKPRSSTTTSASCGCTTARPATCCSALPTRTSFTATESSIVADVDGDGHAEMVMISNGANPGSGGWNCDIAPWNQPDPANNRPAWVAAHRRPCLPRHHRLRRHANSWVGTRTIWNQHAYSVTNICDSARQRLRCRRTSTAPLPASTKQNWKLPWLNNFRQNVQDKGIFDAPDVTVSVTVSCTTPVQIDGLGAQHRPGGPARGRDRRRVRLRRHGAAARHRHHHQGACCPGKPRSSPSRCPAGSAAPTDPYFARVIIDPANKTFNECRDDNNESAKVQANCGPA